MESHEILDSEYQQEYDDNSGIPIELLSSNKFMLLYVMTFGLYSIWWMYKLWNFFKEKEGSDIWPVARAIFSIFFLFGLFEKIKSFARRHGYPHDYSSEGLFGAYLFLTILSNLSILPDPFWMISFLAIFCFIQPINAYNHAITHSDMYYGIEREGFSGRQYALIVIFGLMWILVIIGLFLPDQ